MLDTKPAASFFQALGRTGRRGLQAAIRHNKMLIFGSVWLLLSVYAMAHFVASSHLGDRYELMTFDRMLSGTAAKPFVFRVLVPKLTNSVVEITPRKWQHQLDNSVRRWLLSSGARPVRAALPWLMETYHKPPVYPRLVATLLIYLSLLGYVYMLYKLAAAMMPECEALRWFAPIIGLLTISAFSKPWQYIYDIPVLFLSAACFYTLYTGKLKAYLAFFILACLNRETSIFIFLFFLLWSHRHMERTSFIALSIIQAILFVGIKIVLFYVYIDNPGPLLEFNISRMLRLDILERADHLRLLVIAVLFFLFTYRWPDKPAYCKQALWLLPLMYAGYLFHGNPEEYRVFFDIKPIMVLLATHTLVSAAGFEQVAFFGAEPKEKGDT